MSEASGRCVPARGVGDACDPIACGETVLGHDLTEGTVLGRPSRIATRSVVEVDGRSTVTQQARTGFRFCPCARAAGDEDDPTIRILCASPAAGGCAIDDRLAYDRAIEGEPETEFTWRWPTIDDRATVNREPPLAERPAAYRWTSAHPAFQRSYVGDWAIDADADRWTALFGDSAQGPFSVTLTGVLWTHVPGPASGGMFPDEVRLLAHHYWSGVATRAEGPTPFPCVRHIAPLSPPGCVFCNSGFPAPYIMLPYNDLRCLGAPELPQLGLPGLPIDPRPYLPFDPSVVFGSALDNPGVRWIAPAEPREWLPTFGPRLLAIDSTSAEPLRPLVRVIETGQGFTLADQTCGPKGCDPTNAPPLGEVTPFAGSSSAASTAVVSGSPGLGALLDGLLGGRRQTAPMALVLSARRDAVWALSGDARTEVGTLAQRGLTSGAEAAFQVALGAVLAATYDPSRDALYVLDEVEQGHGWRRVRKARLVRVMLRDVTDAAAATEVLAEWPRLSLNERFALSADGTGALWLVASPGERMPLAAHVVVRLEARTTASERWHASRIFLGTGRLAEVAPTSDLRGLSYITEARDGTQSPTGIRADRLRPLGLGDLARCF